MIYDDSNRDYKLHNNYENQQSYNYFQKNASFDAGESGPSFMVGRAIMGTNHAHKYIAKDDILVRLLLANFTATLTVEQKKQFTLILQLIRSKKKVASRDRNADNKADRGVDTVTDIVLFDSSSKIPH